MSGLEDLDLDINNYNLDDILDLFQLQNKEIDYGDMKEAKKIVVMTHPDKTNLDPKFFLFFKEAFGLLKQVYDFQQKSENYNDNIIIARENIYDKSGLNNNNKEDKKLINQFSKKENFNKEFNKLFEKNRVKNESIDTGYGTWMKSDEGLENKEVKTIGEMNEIIEEKKENLKSLVVHKDIMTMENKSNGSYLANTKPEEYSSDVFSKLPYEDLRKAHTETVVPVNMKDFHNTKKFSSVNELNQFRNAQDINSSSLDQSKQFLKKKEELENRNNMERAYNLAKQSEESMRANKGVWGSLKQITNSK
jgi:hypothetical protein